jgi:hypothetical protein
MLPPRPPGSVTLHRLSSAVAVSGETAMLSATRPCVLLAVSVLFLASASAIPAQSGGKPPKQLTPEQIKAGYYVGGATVVVPDGGSASVSSFCSVADGRNEAGVPGLGKIPYVSRGFRNVGAGRSMQRLGISVSVRIIDLRAMDEELLGKRP